MNPEIKFESFFCFIFLGAFETLWLNSSLNQFYPIPKIQNCLNRVTFKGTNILKRALIIKAFVIIFHDRLE